MMIGVYARWKIILRVYIILSLSTYALGAGCGSTPASIRAIWDPANLQYVGYTLGLLMIIIQGVKYIVADSAQERADVKKGLLYVVIGLLVIRGYTSLTDFYCDIAHISY